MPGIRYWTHVFSMRFTTQALRSGASSSGNSMTLDEALRLVARLGHKSQSRPNAGNQKPGNVRVGSRRNCKEGGCVFVCQSAHNQRRYGIALVVGARLVPFFFRCLFFNRTSAYSNLAEAAYSACKFSLVATVATNHISRLIALHFTHFDPYYAILELEYLSHRTNRLSTAMSELKQHNHHSYLGSFPLSAQDYVKKAKQASSGMKASTEP